MSKTSVESRQSRVERVALPAFMLLMVSGCSLLRHPPTIPEPVHFIAVMPIERAEPSSVTLPEERPRSEPGAERLATIEGGEPRSVTLPKEPPRLEPGAERVVTAQIYAVLSESPEWRFVPDIAVAQALSKVGSDGDLAVRARALGQAVGADAVLFGTVSRYV